MEFLCFCEVYGNTDALYRNTDGDGNLRVAEFIEIQMAMAITRGRVYRNTDFDGNLRAAAEFIEIQKAMGVYAAAWFIEIQMAMELLGWDVLKKLVFSHFLILHFSFK